MKNPFKFGTVVDGAFFRSFLHGQGEGITIYRAIVGKRESFGVNQPAEIRENQSGM